jgi:hypothetical protein
MPPNNLNRYAVGQPGRESMLERQHKGIATAQRDGKCRCRAPTVQRRAAEIGFSCSRLFTTTSGLADGTAPTQPPTDPLPWRRSAPARYRHNLPSQRSTLHASSGTSCDRTRLVTSNCRLITGDVCVCRKPAMVAIHRKNAQGVSL